MVDQVDPVAGVVIAVLLTGVAVWQRRAAILTWLGFVRD